jgi:hypothetical protein
MKKIIIQYCWIIGIVALVFLLASCINKPIEKTKQPSVYDGSLGLMLGCMFDPSECDKIKKNAEQEEITKEWEEIDKQNSHK